MNEKIERIKNHFREHKHVYGYGAMSLAVIVVGGFAFKKSGGTTIINTIAPIFNNNNESGLGGHLRKIVYCFELDKYYESVTAAAEAAGMSIAVMSKHLNGHTEHVNSMHYKIVGVAN